MPRKLPIRRNGPLNKKNFQKIANLVNRSMEPDQLYSYEQFFEEFIYKIIKKNKKRGIHHSNLQTRQRIKKGINETLNKKMKEPKLIFTTYRLGVRLESNKNILPIKLMKKALKKEFACAENSIYRFERLINTGKLTSKGEKTMKSLVEDRKDHKIKTARKVLELEEIDPEVANLISYDVLSAKHTMNILVFDDDDEVTKE